LQHKKIHDEQLIIVPVTLDPITLLFFIKS